MNTFGGAWSRFKKYRPFLWELVKRDFKHKYKRSSLGVVWSVLHPLMTMTVLVIVFSTLFARSIENFAVYLLCGQTIFHFYSEATNMAMGSIIGNATFVHRVYAPLYMLPLSRVLSSLINVGLSMIALIAIVIATGVKFSFTMLLFPIPIIYTFIFSFGIGMFLSSVMVFFRDASHLYSVLILMLMYMSAIFYPAEILPGPAFTFYQWNPVANFIKMFRNVIVYNTFPTVTDHLKCILFCILALLLGIAFFRGKQNKFIMHV